MNYYTIIKHEISIKLLKYYDVVGVTLFRYPKIHFSGNFWWSKSEHIYTLPYLISEKYLAPEMYICSNPSVKYIGLSREDDVFENSSFHKHLNLTDEQISNNLSEEIITNPWGLQVLYLC